MWKFILHKFYGGMSCGYTEEEISREKAIQLILDNKAKPYSDNSVFGHDYITVRMEYDYAVFEVMEGYKDEK